MGGIAHFNVSAGKRFAGFAPPHKELDHNTAPGAPKNPNHGVGATHASPAPRPDSEPWGRGDACVARAAPGIRTMPLSGRGMPRPYRRDRRTDETIRGSEPHVRGRPEIRTPRPGPPGNSNHGVGATHASPAPRLGSEPCRYPGEACLAPTGFDPDSPDLSPNVRDFP